MLYALLYWNMPILNWHLGFDLNPLKHTLSRYLDKLKNFILLIYTMHILIHLVKINLN